jgi:hypothetical protein
LRLLIEVMGTVSRVFLSLIIGAWNVAFVTSYMWRALSYRELGLVEVPYMPSLVGLQILPRHGSAPATQLSGNDLLVSVGVREQ